MLAWRNLPNAITLLRAALVIPVVLFLLEGRVDWALYLFLVAAISDGLDGYLAKQFGWTSWLGSIIDPLADKLLLIASYMAIGWLSLLPVWLVCAVIIRDLIILIGAIFYYYLFGSFTGEPTQLSKVNTLVQAGLVFLVLFNQAVLGLPEGLISSLIFIVLMTTVGSGLSYISIWWQRALQAKSAATCLRDIKRG